MPYFVFEISSAQVYALLGQFEDYRSAKALCKEARSKSGRDGDAGIRMVNAKSEKAGIALLKERRKPASPVEEWEV